MVLQPASPATPRADAPSPHPQLVPALQPRVETVPFRRNHDRLMARARRRQAQLAELHPASVAKRLALAHRIQSEINEGIYEDQADVARQHYLSRARLTQLLNLLLLAPDIQEEVLNLRYPAGREPITERSLRPLTRLYLWSEQRKAWRSLLSG